MQLYDTPDQKNRTHIYMDLSHIDPKAGFLAPYWVPGAIGTYFGENIAATRPPH